MRKIILSNDIISEIINLYQSDLSASKIGRQFGLSGEYIRCLLKNNKVIVRKYHEINRKHIVDEHYFDVIDTEKKAYFLGLLFADGNVASKSNAITIKLHQRDKNILLILSNIIFGKEILYVSEENYILKFSSNHIKNRLIELGCMPNKTFKLKFPNITENLFHHFIRGYFDGDGSIYSHKKDYAANLMSTEDFCLVVKSIISKQVGLTSKIYKNESMLAHGNDITSYLLYRGNRRVAKLMNWLYQDATIYLDRKYQKYLQLKSALENTDNKKNICNLLVTSL